MKKEKNSVAVKVYYHNGEHRLYTCPQDAKSSYAVLDTYKRLQGVKTAVLSLVEDDSPRASAISKMIDEIVEHEAGETYGETLRRILKVGVVGWDDATDEEIKEEHKNLFQS